MNTFDLSKRYSCSFCDRTYSRKFDMKRHEQNVHHKMKEDKYENEDPNTGDEATEDDCQSEPPFKKQRVEEEFSDDDAAAQTSDSENEGEDDSSNSEAPNGTEDPEDNRAYQEWFEQAMADTEEMRNEKYQKYISQGMDKEDAKEKAHVKVLWAVKRNFFDLYSEFLQQNLSLEEDDTNREILADLTEKVENGMSTPKAVRRVLAKHGTKFEGLFQYQEEDGDDGEEEMERDQN